MSEAWIETFTGLRFDTLDPHPEMIDIKDIAHSLSQTCRWTGHTKYHYSVAQHALYCSYLVSDCDAFWALNHDDAEAYIGDMSRPLKHFSEAGDHYRLVEERIMTAICHKFGMQLIPPASVKVADEEMLFAEKKTIMTGHAGWSTKESWAGKNPASVLITKMYPEDVEQLFLKRFDELYGGLNGNLRFDIPNA